MTSGPRCRAARQVREPPGAAEKHHERPRDHAWPRREGTQRPASGKTWRGPGVAAGRGASARPREPRGGGTSAGKQRVLLSGASTVLAPLYAQGSLLQSRASHGWARRLRSLAGRAGLGSPKAAFCPPRKAAGISKARLRTGAPGAVAQPAGAGGDA